MFIRKKDSFIKYEHGSWKPLFHFNFQGQSKKEDIFKGYSNLFAFSDDFMSNDFEFPSHEHQIFIVGTYVIEGKLQHTDSTSNTATTLEAGDLQFTDSAQSVWHSETPISEKVHSIQMWFFPEKFSKKPSYQIIRKSSYKEDGSFFLDNTKLNADVKIGILNTDRDFIIGNLDRKTYIYVIEGKIHTTKGDVLSQEVLVLENEVVDIKNNSQVKLLILSLEQ